MTEILIYGIVGDSWDGLDANTLVPLISAGDDQLDVRINSPGGYVMEGLAILNAITREAAKGRKVTTHIDGLAASMGSVIAMAGSEIVMADNALMMIHNPWDCACGDARELRRAADQLDRIRDQIVGVYSKRTGLAAADLIAMLDEETWFTAQEALALNFVTSISQAMTVSASNVQPFGFRKAPDSPLITAMAMARPPRTAPAAPTRPQETMMDLYKTRAALVAAIAKFQQDGGTQADIDKILQSAVALDARDTLPATGALAINPTPANSTGPVITTADVQNAVASERTRASGIRTAVAKAGLPAAFGQDMIDAGTSLDDARAKIIDKLADASDATMPRNHAPIAVGTEARDKWLIGARNALIARAGLTGIIAQAAKKRGETIDLDPGELRGIRNVELARMALDHAGIACQSYDRDKIVASALTARNSITQTTSDFPVLLENVMHKVLQAAYALAPDTWSRFCGIGSVTDFRPHNRYLRGTFGALDLLNEAGEFKNKSIPDGAKELIKATTKGNIINLSRQAIVNDDMDAFSGLAVDLGRAAKLSIEIDVYALLALDSNNGPAMNDTVALFNSAHNNIATAAAPSVVAFDAIRVLMARQKDVSGNEYLDVRPSIWLGPVELGGTARTINDAVYDPDTVNKLQKPNMVRGLFADVVDTPRLSGTRWYAFADPMLAPALEVAFLNGEQEPFLDSEEGWRTDGTEWKVRLDYGVGAVNWRSAAKNEGA